MCLLSLGLSWVQHSSTTSLQVRFKYSLTSIAVSALTLGAQLFLPALGYESPYSVKLTESPENLCQCESQSPRNDWRLESQTPFEEWYSQSVKKKFQAWGPEPRHYPAPEDLDKKSTEWKRQRLLAVAVRMIGLPYQHHHIPDWNPPADWPWKEVKYGCNSKGLDCSNFTGWLYNYGLGIKLNTNVEKQAENHLIEADRTGGAPIEADVITTNGTDKENYELLKNGLKTGDLLYIQKRDEDKVSHVIMWVGSYGKAPNNVPLIIDCTGEGHKDSNGNDIPVGVHLRPFTPDSWYFKRFSHAHRILKD